ncbi:hypothetical protein AB1Y20_019233 [Prymnesium parvum]|uniref:Uncharacterized protein n=1 Tax=Prymnesium parvum TaxID=97485 RepID=A0AB34JV79_PRYPA
MGSPAPGGDSSNEEANFAHWSDEELPSSDHPVPPVVGFSHDTSDSTFSAHITTLGGTAQVHRQPPAAAGTRDFAPRGLGAAPSSYSTPSYVTRAQSELDTAAPSLASFMPTHQCRHAPTSDPRVADVAPLLPPPSGEFSSSRPPIPPLSFGGPTAASPYTADSYRTLPPQPPPGSGGPSSGYGASYSAYDSATATWIVVKYPGNLHCRRSWSYRRHHDKIRVDNILRDGVPSGGSRN